MTGKAIVIWGASGHARVVADVIRMRGEYQIVGFLDDVNLARKGEEFCGARVLGGSQILSEMKKEGVGALAVAFGDCEPRLAAGGRARLEGFDLPLLIHPSAVLASNAQIGAGALVAAGAVISVAARVGDLAIINTGATIDHDCLIDEGVHISPGVHLGGHVRVGRAAWIGIGAVVSDRCTVGASSIVGAGAVVVRDIESGVVAFGVPAKTVRRVNE